MAVVLVLLSACGGGGNSDGAGEDEPADKQTETTTEAKEVDPMKSKGIGPVDEVELGEINPKLAEEGKVIYEKYCTSCHKPDKKYIGPAPKDILERRSPEWVMNMIINPTEMLQKDPTAKKLLAESNGAIMANQNIDREQARAILEYFRTL